MHVDVAQRRRATLLHDHRQEDGPSIRRRFFMTGDPANKEGEVGSKFKHNPLPFTKDQPNNDDIIELGGKRWRLLPLTKGEKDDNEVGKSRWRLLPMAKNEPDPEVGSSGWRLLPMAKDQPSNDDIIELGSRRWRLLPLASGEEDDEVGKYRWRLLPMAKGSGEL